jgi:phosphate transport system ATP-binding protein
VAIRDVALRCEAGTVTAVIGPSGCGKTSFLMSLNRLTDLIPRCRVSGTVRIGDVETFGPTVDAVELRRRVGMIFQRPNPFPLSIFRNLELPLREHGVTDRSEIQMRIERSLCEAALWDEVKDRLHRPAVHLSGGQQQRLCIARALVLRPDVLLLDEPCSALDPISAGMVEDLFVELRQHCTLVVVTHNLAQARRIADRVAFFWSNGEGGVLVEEGPAERIFSSPQEELTAAYVSGRVG